MDGRSCETGAESMRRTRRAFAICASLIAIARSEEHTSELQSLMRISYAVFCLKKKKKIKQNNNTHKKQKKNMTKIKRQKRIYVVYEAIEIRVKSNTDQTNIHNKGQ